MSILVTTSSTTSRVGLVSVIVSCLSFSHDIIKFFSMVEAVMLASRKVPCSLKVK
jgi:hypothetical protein